MNLTMQDQKALSRAKEQHYLVRESGRQELEGLYHDYCVAEQTYWISIHLHPIRCAECKIGEDHADVWYDLFHISHALTPEAHKALRDYFDRARPVVYKEMDSNLGEAGGYGMVPEYTAEKLAKALSDLFSNPQNHSEEMFYRVYPHAKENS